MFWRLPRQCVEPGAEAVTGGILRRSAGLDELETDDPDSGEILERPVAPVVEGD